MEFIDEKFIYEILDNEKLKNIFIQKDIIQKSKEGKGLSLYECASLLSIEDENLLNELFETAKFVKEKIYGNRLVLFAPLYLTNFCVNNCLYCAFRIDNKSLIRKSLTINEIEDEALALIKQGQKRLLLVCGEHPKKSKLDFIGKAIEKIYSLNINGGNIRRININVAPLDLEGFKILKSFDIGTYQIFQETYNFETYKIMHPSGPKGNYAYRLYAIDRALQAGIDDVGIGALFGLTDYKFETLALLMHAFDIDKKYGIGPHTISIPRLEPAFNAPAANYPPNFVDDLSFKKIIAVIRLAAPYTGIILSTREKPELRRELFNVGVSQISAGSRTSPGSYNNYKLENSSEQSQQFQLGDHRSLDEIVRDCCSLGYMPSFCTSCYRSNRTGDRFMELAKSGNIGKICTPNALATFQEYLIDYASSETLEAGKKFLNNEIEKINSPSIIKSACKMIEQVNLGERDVYI